MHEKEVNVYVMPDNMPDLLLDGFKSKESIIWTENDMNGSDHSPSLDCNNQQSDIKIIEEDEDRIESVKIGSRHFQCVTGLKRAREEYPTFTNGKDSEMCGGRPIKMQLKNGVQKTENGIFLSNSLNEDCRERLELEAPSLNCSNGCEKNIALVDQTLIVCENKNVDTALGLKISLESSDLCCYHRNEINSTIHKQNAVNVRPCRENNLLHPGLRLSLFPKVPPFVNFSPYNVKGELFPIHVHKLLRWKLSTITPLIVRKVVVNSGFRLFRKSAYWGGTWGTHPKSVGFRTLFEYQKMNHIPGTFQIGRKDRLWKSLQKLMAKFGKNKFDLMPTTYVLPRDKKLLRMVWKKTEGSKPWIVKPPASSRGTGIKVIHKWAQIPDNSPVVVQQYISKPFLINETKFDLRLYVLITSVNPLRIYLYNNGLVRFASTKYSNALHTLGDRYVHLTNYSINKLSTKYKPNEDADACQGHKWTLKSLWNYMDKELHLDVSEIWQRLVDLVVKTIISGEHTMSQLTNINLQSRYNAYELFGIDVLLDENLKPWLLEVNISPSLHSASPLDLAVKAPLVHDLMNIVGFQIPSSNKFTESELCSEMGNVPDNRLCFDSRIFSRTLSSADKHKHHYFIQKSREEYLDAILSDLTPDDVRHLIQAEDELTQIGSFQKVFPTTTSHEYLRYLDCPRYYNFLFDAWEMKYHTCREEGIQLLRKKCEQGVHLNISGDEPDSSNTCATLRKCRRKAQNHVKSSTHFQNNSYLALKMKITYLAKPRNYVKRPYVPSRNYLLRSRKPK